MMLQSEGKMAYSIAVEGDLVESRIAHVDPAIVSLTRVGKCSGTTTTLSAHWEQFSRHIDVSEYKVICWYYAMSVVTL